MVVPTLVVHGGAGDIGDSAVAAKLQGVYQAVEKGYVVLDRSEPALDAVIAAVQSMESDPAFNAGKGAVLNLKGQVEMDAMVMDGSTLNMGSVAGVKNIESAIELARLVMEKSPHKFIAGAGANEFAASLNVPTIPDYELVTDAAIKALDDFLHNNLKERISELGFGTVGAVAVDKYGNVAAATSTGGITGKYPGRVGDSPLPGCGTYADNKTGAVSATGAGEAIMRVCLSYRILNSTQTGSNVQTATEEALSYMSQTVGSTAGAITVTPTGDIGIGFNSPRMAWAFKQGNNPIETGIDTPPKTFSHL